MKNNLVLSLIIACGIVVAGVCVGGGLKSIAQKDRVVTVKGLDTREVNADYVVWPMSYSINGNDLADMQKVIKATNAKIRTFLVGKGFKTEDIREGNISVNDLWDNYYTERRSPNRYQMSTTIVLQTEDVERVVENRGCLTELLNQGIVLNTNEWQMDYQFNGLTDIKPEMIEHATANARVVAQKFAEDAQCRLGSIAQASQGQFSITSDEYQPWIKHIRVVTTVNYYLK